MAFTVLDHPLIKHKITMLRKTTTGTNEFRTIVDEIGMLMGYEALKTLEATDKKGTKIKELVK